MYLIFWTSDSCCISLSSTVLNKLISGYLMMFYGFDYAPVQKKFTLKILLVGSQDRNLAHES
jgi:hypothetical protein